MSNKEWLERANKVVANSTFSTDIVFARAEGVGFFDTEGKFYYDFASGPGVANIGWNHPKLVAAVQELLQKGESGYGGNEILNPYWIKLAEKLVELTPGNFPKRVFPSNSGGEAVEAGIIACMLKRPERKAILTFNGDFHGRMGYARTATTSKSVHFMNLPQGVERAHYLIFPEANYERSYNYKDYLDSQIGRFAKDINVAVIELVQGEGGINVASNWAMDDLMSFLQENGIYVLVDEVQTGFGRTGKMWACEHYGIEPDIMALAKGASGGVSPIGLTVLREELNFSDSRGHSNTFGGNPLSSCVAFTTLEIIQEEKLAERANKLGIYMMYYSLAKIPPSYHDGIGGLGLMQRLKFKNGEIRDRVVAEALKRGLFLMGAGESAIRLMPPLTIQKEEIRKAFSILSEAIKIVTE